MNDIVKKQINDLKIKREADLTRSVSSSLLGKLKTFSDDKCILIDVSGSMDEEINDGSTKFNVMKNTLASIEGYRRFEFSSDCKEITQTGLCPRPYGGTSMGLAFSHVKDKGIKHVILVTDGQPDSQAHALKSAEGLKIDIIYIGPDPVPEFLKNLAKVSDGTFENIKMLQSGESTKFLKAKITGLLGA